jgi:hypothetical protein
MYRQHDLRSDDHRLTCWLEVDSRVKEGVLITLKGDDRFWEVMRIYKHSVEKPPHQPWKVGGLL